MSVIHIQICKGWNKKPDKWSIRIGDIEGGTECLNITKEELFSEIKDALRDFEEKQKCQK